MKKNRKGLLNQIMIVVILITVIIAIIGVFSLASIVLPVLTGEGIEVATLLQTSMNESGIAEMNDAGQVATSTTINVLGIFELLVYLFFFGLVIGFIMVAYYVRTYPFLAFFWAGGMVITTIIAMIMSNAYEQAKTGDLAQFYNTWGTNDLLMSYLPHIMAVVTIVGGIVLFVLVSRDSEGETQAL
jgi:hypothetical protein